MDTGPISNYGHPKYVSFAFPDLLVPFLAPIVTEPHDPPEKDDIAQVFLLSPASPEEQDDCFKTIS